MKRKYIVSLLVSIFLVSLLNAQEVTKKLSEAETAYKNGKYEDARFALQQALSEIDIILGKQVLDLLPVKMASLPAVMKDDQNSGNTGVSGIYVSRNYGQPTELLKTVSVQIISDSPLLTSINAILAIPVIGMGDPNQKRIKVDGYKALLQKSESEGKISFDIQVPFDNSLLTFKCSGFSETEATAMVNTISVTKIAAITK